MKKKKSLHVHTDRIKRQNFGTKEALHVHEILNCSTITFLEPVEIGLLSVAVKYRGNCKW